MSEPKRIVPITAHRPKRGPAPDPSTGGCDRPHPPIPGERPTMDLGAAELFVLAALRAWVAPIRAPGRPHPDWREIMRLGRVCGATALAFHHLLSTVAQAARRSLDVRCPSCPSLGQDEEAMLALVVALQAGDAPGARGTLADWLRPEAIGTALSHAHRFAEGSAEAGMRLPPTAERRPRGATLH